MGQAENKHLFIVICINRSKCGPKIPSLYFAAVQKLLYYPSWKMVTSESTPHNRCSISVRIQTGQLCQVCIYGQL